MLPAEGEKVLPAEAGSTFGKYQLFATLGRGGMADVFLAVARGPMGFNKLAVVKRLRTALSEEPAFLSMFLDEARLAARLSHPNIVHTYEVGEESSSYFIAMEYLEGQPLNKIIKEAAKTQKKVDPALAARLVADALHGLHHAHELKDYDGTPLRIIHRDVSPHNIFVTYDGIVKLVDFGIAKAALSSTHTEVGVLKGKVAYMAPEQAVGGAVDRRADLFAMGIVLWELLTRRRLMTGDTAAATLHRLVSLPVPRVSDALPDVDPKLDAIVAKALEKDPAKRFQTAAEMRDALEAFAMTSGTARTEDVGALVVDMFGTVRADVQKQIQAHMAKVASGETQAEPLALTLESIRRFDSANPSGALLKLGGSGSGSGAVSFPLPGPPLPSDDVTQRTTTANPPPDRKGAIIVALLALLVVLVVVLIVLRLAAPPVTAGSGVPVAVTATAIGASPTNGSASEPSPSPAVAHSTDTPDTTAPPSPPAAVTVAELDAPSAKPPVAAPGWNPRRVAPRAPAVAASAPAPTVKKEPTPDPAPTVQPETANGFLTLSTYPWTKVTEAGRSLGTTPVVRVPLAPGAHVLTLENPEQGIKQTVTVTIKSGENVTKSLGFK